MFRFIFIDFTVPAASQPYSSHSDLWWEECPGMVLVLVVVPLTHSHKTQSFIVQPPLSPWPLAVMHTGILLRYILLFSLAGRLVAHWSGCMGYGPGSGVQHPYHRRSHCSGSLPSSHRGCWTGRCCQPPPSTAFLCILTWSDWGTRALGRTVS